jgi:AcrR family transcriptional regulator
MSIRDDILAAGMGLLRERGIAALTQPRVAAAAVKRRHLTYYFPPALICC